MNLQDHHDDIRQEQKWEMQALSSTSSVDEVASEPNGNEESTDTTATVNDCGGVGGDDSGLQTNNSNSLNINNNTIAINNNNCDTIKNNNNQCTTTTSLKLVNDVEAVPAIALIEHQNPLLRSVNIGN